MTGRATQNKKTRAHKLSTLLTDREYDTIVHYCKKYKVRNRSKLVRDMIFTSIMENYEKDYPTLFDKQVLADLVVEKR